MSLFNGTGVERNGERGANKRKLGKMGWKTDGRWEKDAGGLIPFIPARKFN